MNFHIFDSCLTYFQKGGKIAKQFEYAGMVELADTLDLGSNGYPVQVRVLLPAPENDKFRQKLVVFSYIRLTASYMHLRCVIFASQVICLRALGANIISLKP